MPLPQRKPLRLENFNYNAPGAYFLTICTKNRECILSQIVGGGAFDAPKSVLSDIGKVVDKYIQSSKKITALKLQNYVIMPNHIHLLVLLEEHQSGTSKAPSPTNDVIPHYVSTLKRFINRELGENIFQRSYHDHVIRNQNDYLEIWQYIDNNPTRWKEDKLYIPS